MAEDVEHHLRGGVDGARGKRRVHVAQQWEQRDRVVVEQVRAREPEEVAEHAVGVPVDRKARKGVEEIVDGVMPLAVDDREHLGDEPLESCRRIELVDLGGQSLGEERLMVREAEVHQLAVGNVRVLAVPLREGQEVGDVVHLQHDVVARPHALEHAIERRDAAAEVLTLRHMSRPHPWGRWCAEDTPDTPRAAHRVRPSW